LERSAVILTERVSTKFSQDKTALELAGKPLIRHVIDAVGPAVEEIIVVADSEEKIKQYTKILGGNVRFALDKYQSQGTLAGALTGLSAAQGKYTLLMSVDTPLVAKEVVTLLFDLCVGKAAAIPRWPDEQIAPLQAVYRTNMALEAARQAVDEGKLDVQAMIDKLRGVRYVSTLVIQQLDPDLNTFFTINSPLDLKRAAAMGKPRKTKSGKRKTHSVKA
jgi:molybdopterin-guanine dinucleotide biosynthesis protein A